MFGYGQFKHVQREKKERYPPLSCCSLPNIHQNVGSKTQFTPNDLMVVSGENLDSDVLPQR